MSKNKPTIEFLNKRATYDYFIHETFEAGIVLTGTEIKSIRGGKVNIKDAYCLFQQGELYVKNMYIAEYKFGSYANHKERGDRKLLLTKMEIKKIDRKSREKGYTIVPTRLFVNDRGLAKLEIGLASGKKSYDKRHSIRDKDQKRELARMKKIQ